ncbi:ATP-binding protein [Vibrio parahaemolyticus]|nr:ATP-binding protein [Vibrio parahaemolyticus]
MKLIKVKSSGLYYPLSEPTADVTSQNLFTVIIGKNGVGKSRLLAHIADTLINIKSYGQNHSKLVRDRRFELRFQNEDKDVNVYSGKGKSKGRIFEKNDVTKSNFCTKLIAASTSPFDKFPLEKNDNQIKSGSDSFYSYIGLKNAAGTLSDKNLVKTFAISLLEENQKRAVERILSYLGFDKRISINFRHNKDRYFSKKALTNKDISLAQAIKSSEGIYQKVLLDNNMEMSRFIVEALHQEQIEKLKNIEIKKHEIIRLRDGKLKNIYLKSNVVNRKINDLIGTVNLPKSFTSTDPISKKIRNSIIQSLQLNFSNVESITLTKKDGSNLRFEDSSSGEKALLLLACSIANKIKNDSVVLIDEPEISLHPEWQENFIELLNAAFKHFKNCHFIIATHSPLVISQLSTKNCYILNMDEDEMYSSSDYSNRSSDYQLARLFSTPGNHNEYLNRLCVSLLSSISKHGELNAEQLKDLEFLINLKPTLNDDDTVKQLIDVLEKAKELLP